MSLSPRALRSRVAASIGQTLGSEWRESPQPFELFPGTVGDNQVTTTFEYAVGLRGTVAQEGRQRRADTDTDRGVLVLTDVRVRAAVPLRADNQVESVDYGLDAEMAALDGTLATNGDPDLTIRFVEVIARTHPFAGVFLVELRFEALHRYPLGRDAAAYG